MADQDTMASKRQTEEPDPLARAEETAGRAAPEVNTPPEPPEAGKPEAARGARPEAAPRPVRPPRRAAPPPVKPRPQPAADRFLPLLAALALLVAFAAPVLEDQLLDRVGIATPAFRAQQEAALTLARQEQKLADLRQRLTTATAQLANTRADLQQSALGGTGGAAWGRLLSLGRVADALRGATPFASSLAVALAVGAGIDEFRADMAQLAAYSGTGVPTRTDIGHEFHRIVEDTMRPGGLLPSGLARRLDSLNPFTPGPSAPPDPTPDLVQAAAARLAEGDVEEAIARVRQIGGVNQAAFAGWLEDAQARVNADALVRRIDRALMQMGRELPR